MRVSLGGVSVDLGGNLEARAQQALGQVQGAAVHAVVETGRMWLGPAARILGTQHPAVVAMQQLVDEADRKELQP